MKFSHTYHNTVSQYSNSCETFTLVWFACEHTGNFGFVDLIFFLHIDSCKPSLNVDFVNATKTKLKFITESGYVSGSGYVLLKAFKLSYLLFHYTPILETITDFCCSNQSNKYLLTVVVLKV